MGAHSVERVLALHQSLGESPVWCARGIVEVPVSHVTSCAFGDADLRRLYVTSARQRLTSEELAEQPDAVSLFAVRLPVAGLPEPECRL